MSILMPETINLTYNLGGEIVATYCLNPRLTFLLVVGIQCIEDEMKEDLHFPFPINQYWTPLASGRTLVSLNIVLGERGKCSNTFVQDCSLGNFHVLN